MNFSSHQNQIISEITEALKEQKPVLVEKFQEVLAKASELYKTRDYEFWLQTLENTELEQLPITKYGYSNAKYSLSHLSKADKNTAQSTISNICECLFTYSSEEEMCIMQSDFHFYFCHETNSIYKQSELGIVEGIESCGKGKRRIAFVSELSVENSAEYF